MSAFVWNGHAEPRGGLLCVVQTDRVLLVLGNGVTSHGGEHRLSAPASTRSTETQLCAGTPLVLGGEEHRHPGVDLRGAEPSGRESGVSTPGPAFRGQLGCPERGHSHGW